jgi:hypothetical protein
MINIVASQKTENQKSPNARPATSAAVMHAHNNMQVDCGAQDHEG